MSRSKAARGDRHARARPRGASQRANGESGGTVSAKWPVFRGVAIFCAAMFAFYALEHTTMGRGDFRRSYLELIALASGKVISLFGYDAVSDGTLIKSSVFSVNIIRGCDATDPIAAFIAAVLALPSSVRAKFLGIVAGTTILLTINLVRIVSLFFIGVYLPRAFETMHIGVWQVLFFVLAVACWAIWAQWASCATVKLADD